MWCNGVTLCPISLCIIFQTFWRNLSCTSRSFPPWCKLSVIRLPLQFLINFWISCDFGGKLVAPGGWSNFLLSIPVPAGHLGHTVCYPRWQHGEVWSARLPVTGKAPLAIACLFGKARRLLQPPLLYNKFLTSFGRSSSSTFCGKVNITISARCWIPTSRNTLLVLWPTGGCQIWE